MSVRFSQPLVAFSSFAERCIRVSRALDRFYCAPACPVEKYISCFSLLFHYLGLEAQLELMN